MAAEKLLGVMEKHIKLNKSVFFNAIAHVF